MTQSVLNNAYNSYPIYSLMCSIYCCFKSYYCLCVVFISLQRAMKHFTLHFFCLSSIILSHSKTTVNLCCYLFAVMCVDVQANPCAIAFVCKYACVKVTDLNI